jgi:hypothetical protein
MTALRDRIFDILTYYALNGEEKTLEKYKIKQDTLRRYKNELKRLRSSIEDEPEVVAPKVLLFDIETSPMIVTVWGLYKQRIPHTNVIKDWNIISWAGKWLNHSEVFGDVLTPEEAISGDDNRILNSIWEKFDEADIVIAHNGDNFDIKKLNTRWLLNGFYQPSKYRSIDTYKVSSGQFSFSSNKLDYIATLTQNKQKIKTDYDLWKRCMKGNKEALDEMFTYNKKDVVLLEDVYMVLRPWIKSHPNLGLYMETDENVCPHCGGTDLSYDGHYYTTTAGKFATIRCKCGAISRQKKSVANKELLRSIPK